MKKINLILLALCLPFLTNAQWNAITKIKGNGNMITKNITTTSYDEIRVSGFFDVTLIAGAEGKVTLRAEENLANHIEIIVDNNTLKIGVENGAVIVPSRGCKIAITVPFDNLSAVSLAGSGDVRTKSVIKADQFKSTLSGSGDLRLDVDVNQMDANANGSGNMTLKGKAERLQCSVIGSGDLNASALQSEQVSATVTGSGDCKVYCSGNLEARVVGSGDIHYDGDPKKKDTKVTGSGNISKG